MLHSGAAVSQEIEFGHLAWLCTHGRCCACRLLSGRMMYACTARAAHIMQHRSRHNMAVVKSLLQDASSFKGTLPDMPPIDDQ